jgi:hypothetical protein
MQIGDLVAYYCVSGQNADNLYSILCAPSGRMTFAEETPGAQSVQTNSNNTQTPLTYGGIPVLSEARNINYSILEIIGTDPATESFINVVNSLVKKTY